MTAETTSPLQAIRDKLALRVGENAVFDGWTVKAVEMAAEQEKVDPAQARLAFGKDPVGMVDAFVAAVDARMAEHFTPELLETMKIRDKITEMIWKRLEIMEPAREAVRSALSIMAMPQNAPRGMRIGWRSADRMWRLAGDNSTDFNHYTKRMTLGAVYGSTLLAWLDDDSEGRTESRAFLERRIDNVMQFEKAKAQWRGNAIQRPSLTRFLGRLRYPPQ